MGVTVRKGRSRTVTITLTRFQGKGMEGVTTYVMSFIGDQNRVDNVQDDFNKVPISHLQWKGIKGPRLKTITLEIIKTKQKIVLNLSFR